MITSLRIKNYALIDDLDVSFTPRLNIITGETGAGKSIILSALSLLLGGRADLKTVGRTDAKSVIEGVFQLDEKSPARKIFSQNDLDWDNGQCILRREILPSGRSRAFVNDSPVNLTVIQEIALQLVDIHSQHQNLLLSDPAFQLRIIDSFADNDELLREYATLYGQLREAMRAFRQAKAAIARDSENSDFMEFQLGQLRQLDVNEGELERLEAELEEMSSASEEKSYAEEAAQALTDGQVNAIDLIRSARDACSEIADRFEEADNIDARFDSILLELNDIAETVTAVNSSLTADPSDIEHTSRRINQIRSLMKKHHVETDAELIALREQLEEKLDRLENSDEILAEFEAAARKSHRKALELARRISARRSEAARQFADQLTEKAVPLGMKNLRVVIDINQSDLSATGCDSVDFRFAFNKNQEPIGVGGAASGGEISRLMLCIKAIIANRIQLPTIIFDEIDTGVSGDVAARIGRMMDGMSQCLQVIAITHLPQVAAHGHSHLKVFKADDELSTHTHIELLSPERRIDELALMLSGRSDDPAARQTAISLLNVKP